MHPDNVGTMTELSPAHDTSSMPPEPPRQHATHSDTEVVTRCLALRCLQTGFQQLQGCPGEHPHVRFAIRHPGFYSEGALDRASYSDTGMASSIAVAIANGAAGTCLTQAPGRSQVVANCTRVEQGVWLGAGAHAGVCFIRHMKYTAS